MGNWYLFEPNGVGIPKAGEFYQDDMGCPVKMGRGERVNMPLLRMKKFDNLKDMKEYIKELEAKP